MTSGQAVTDADRWRILSRLAAGLPVRRIGRELGLHRTTVSAVLREAAVSWWRERVAAERMEELRGRE